jgi:hypothetical protein
VCVLLSPAPSPSPHVDHWQVYSEIATVAGVGVALLLGVVTAIITIFHLKMTRDGILLEQQQAEATAARTEAAAALTEGYTRRVVEALESIAAAGGPVTARAPRVQWSLANHEGSRYVLTNTGDSVARQVQVSSDPTLILRDVPADEDVRPGEVISFMAIPSLGTRDRTITVTWSSDGDSARDRWRYPLPPAGK